MDPYLEGHLWPDVHSRLPNEISRRLGPLLRPRYVARLATYLVEDEEPEAEVGIKYPDVEVLATPVLSPLEVRIVNAYLVTLTRRGSSLIGLWPLGIGDPLPVVPVPLRDPDPDVELDLGAALRAVYDEGGYDLSVDYARPPPPPALSPSDEAWAKKRIQAWRRDQREAGEA
jgi:hypothetical protein